MKKFSLLALVAVMVMAFAGAAFAADAGDLQAKVTGMKADADHTALNNGISSGTGTAFETKVYYIGEGAAFKVGGKFSTEAPSKAFDTNAKLAGFTTELKSFTATVTGSDALTDVAFSLADIPFATDSITGLGVYVVNSSKPDQAAADTATYTFNKTLVAFDTAKITRQFQNGKPISGPDATIVVPLSTAGIKDATFGTALEAFNGETKIEAAGVDGMTFTLDSKKGVVIGGTPTTNGTYTITLKTAQDNETLSVTETKVEEAGSDVEDIAVAGKIATKGTVVATIEITVADYTVTPESVTWLIGTSADAVVSFDVNMAFATEFAGVSNDTKALIVKADLGTNEFATSNDVNVAKKGDNIQVGIKKEFFDKAVAGFTPKSDGSINETIKLKVVDSVAKSADITLNFTKAADPVLEPGNAKQPTTQIIATVTSNANVDPAAKVGAASQDAAEAIMNDAAIKFAKSFDVDGKLQRTVAATLVGAQSSDVTPLQTVSADVAEGKIATFAFEVPGGSLIDARSYTRGASPDVLVIRKVKANNSYANFAYAKTANDVKDGTFMLFNKSGDVRELNLVSNDKSYTLVVFVQDKATSNDFDLDAAKGKILDPVVAVKARHGSGSSSSCDMGFGLAAVAGLAALALRKRSK